MGKIKFIVLLLLCAMIIACGTSPNKNESKQETQKYALQQLLDSCLSQQPNAMNNDVSRSILADTIKSTVQKFIGDSLPFLADIPLQYEMCSEYPRHFESFESEIDKNAGKYIVKFGFGEITSKCKLSDDYQATFQVFTIMNKEQVATLVDNALYRVNGVFVDFANNSKETGFVLPNGKCLVDYPKVITSYGKPYFMLGTFILENPTITPIN